MNRRGNPGIIAATLSLGVALTVTGCGPADSTPSPSETSALPTTPAPSESVEPSEEPEPTPEPIVLPADCAVMNPAASELHQFDITEVSHPPFSTFDEYTGPVAKNAMSQAIQVASCGWVTSFHSGVSQWVAELPDEVAQDLLSQLRGSVYVESAHAGFPVFTRVFALDSMVTADSTLEITYVLIESVWIALIAVDTALGPLIPDAVTAVLDANPSLTP